MQLDKNSFESALNQDRQALTQHPRADKIYGPGVDLIGQEEVKVE
jgi:hypothetical protein